MGRVSQLSRPGFGAAHRNTAHRAKRFLAQSLAQIPGRNNRRRLRRRALAPANSARPAPRASRLHLTLAFGAVYLLWGSSYLGIRFAIETIPPFLMGGTRT